MSTLSVLGGLIQFTAVWRLEMLMLDAVMSLSGASRAEGGAKGEGASWQHESVVGRSPFLQPHALAKRSLAVCFETLGLG